MVVWNGMMIAKDEHSGWMSGIFWSRADRTYDRTYDCFARKINEEKY